MLIFAVTVGNCAYAIASHFHPLTLAFTFFAAALWFCQFVTEALDAHLLTIRNQR